VAGDRFGEHQPAEGIQPRRQQTLFQRRRQLPVQNCRSGQQRVGDARDRHPARQLPQRGRDRPGSQRDTTGTRRSGEHDLPGVGTAGQAGASGDHPDRATGTVLSHATAIGSPVP
jgi:hypothetical protein